ncbi:MAG: Ig-like domain-containing protein [Clostridia bacterium]
MKKMLAVLLTIAMLLPSLTTVIAASVEQISISAVPAKEKIETASTGIKTTTGEKRNVKFTPTKDATELFGFSTYYAGGSETDSYGFIRFLSNAPETVEYLNGYYERPFTAGDYVPSVQAIFAVKNLGVGYALMRIDATTYAEIEIKAYNNFYFMDMAFDISSGVMYGVNDKSLYTIDLASGDYTEVGMSGTPKDFFTLACSDAGILYAVDLDGSLYTLDKATGAGTLIGNTGVTVTYLQSMTWDHVNGGLYWANSNQNDGILYSVDPATASVTALGNINGVNMEVTCLFTKGASPVDPIAVTGVNVIPTEATLKTGRTLKLTARIQPWDATESGVSWASDNPSVATVDENGLVTAVAYGEATITATTVEGGFTDSCVITVPDNAQIDAAFDSAINATGGNYHFINDDLYPWEPVTVGERTAVKSSTAGIHGTRDSITMPPIHMYRGNTISFDWFVSCEMGWDSMAFAVNGENIAMFSLESTEFENYIYRISTEGDYTFSWNYVKDSVGSAGEDCAYLDNVAIDATIPGPVTGVTLTPSTVDLYQTQKAQLTANILPSSALDIGMIFSTDDATVATVDETGLVTAREAGIAIITVTTHDGGFTATSTINVISTAELMADINAALNVEGGTLSFGMDMVNTWAVDATTFPGRSVAHSQTMGMGGTSTAITLIATVNSPKIITFDWMVNSERSYDKGIFAIDGIEQARISSTDMIDFETAVFGAGAPGEHTYTWTYVKDPSSDDGQDILWLDNITITEAPVPQSVAMNATAKVHTGQTIKLDAAVVPVYATDTSIIYSTSDATKVIVDQNGFITGVSEGTATVTATAVNGVHSDCTVTIFNTVPAPDGKLYGFVSAPAGLTENLDGLVRIDPSNATAEGVAAYINDIFAAEYYNGVIYAFDYTMTEFVTFDAMTGEVFSRVAGSEVIYDMAYDYTTNTMYAIFGEEERGLATVDLTTGELTHIGLMPADCVIITLAADNLGKLYGVAIESGMLYEIDKETAECIEIGNTTAGMVSYVQSMTYSFESDTLYWAGYTTTPNNGGFLYSVDRNTGVATTVFDAPIGEICGLIAFNQSSDPSDPTAVTGVSIDPPTINLAWRGSGELKAIIEPVNAINKKVTWASENENIVTVDNKGKLFGVATGTTNVTATSVDGGFVATCVVTVGESPYHPVAPGKAIIMLTAADVWGDGSGYQMLLDSTHSLFGTTIPTAGPLTPSDDVPAEIYNQFDYKIPVMADGILTTHNVVTNNESVYILVDAGTYDFCITNPVPGECVWIAFSTNGSLGRCDDFVVEEGHIYEFGVERRGQNDFVTMTSELIGTSGETTYDPGDANLDGVVNTGDVSFLLKSLIGLEILSDEGRAVSDLNNDGNVNTGDAAIILGMCID